ncbi:MAG: Lrp/AsnC family transcriptional regulator [Betaproteobacteria bacterium]|nr:Lrp/AsnC family transcriptional regulator [Betaproteobacteria bacterium]MBK9608464.1 Lrp/AsnC family transcriptional regulator [Betaproteobacteria bacterium]
MDRIDKKLLSLLQEDADRPLAELAEAVHLTPTPCWKRIQKLQQLGVIRKKVVLCDPAKLNLGLTAFVAVRTTQHNEQWLRKFAAAVQSIPEIVEAYRMSGEIDYMLRIVVPDIQGYDTVYRKLIRAVELFDVSSSFAMERIKYSTALPVDFA